MRVADALAVVGSLQFGLSGPLDCHVYALRGEHSLVLIDAGAGTHTDQLLKNVSVDFSGASVAAVLITHCHVDHCGGAAAIRQRTGCKIIAPELCRMTLQTADEEASGLRVAREQGIYPPEFRLPPCPVDVTVADGETFTAAGMEFTAIHVRGHSRDAHCYLTRCKGRNWLFTGDVVFYGGVLGVVNAEGSGMDGYRADIGKLCGLDVDGLFPGHGLFTFCRGQRHLDCAIEQTRKGFVGRQIGQGDLIF
jgi:glyoxylase-like metal-dependent hydrolase (beta-lactamase superfamily II)